MIRKPQFEYIIVEMRDVVWAFCQIENHIMILMPFIQELRYISDLISIDRLETIGWKTHSNDTELDKIICMRNERMTKSKHVVGRTEE